MLGGEKRKAADLTGRRFGRLVAMRPTGESNPKKGRLWECRCDCGNTRIVPAAYLLEGEVRSCGCLHDELFARHRKRAWESAHQGGTQPGLLREMKPRAGNRSGVRGVSWHKAQRKWQARITFQGKTIFLGYFDKLKDAANARKAAEENYFEKYLKK